MSSTGIYTSQVEEVFEKFLSSELIGMHGKLVASLGSTSINVTTKDVMGGVIQDWLYTWMKQSKFDVTPNPNTQMPPDFYLADSTPFEVKTFFCKARKPAFDLANFSAYIRDLLVHPARLDDDHLIFSYDVGSDYWSIENVWLRKIWEMSGPSPTNHVELQAKQRSAVNLRPKNFVIQSSNTFKSRNDFVVAISRAMDKFGQYPDGFSSGSAWLEQVKVRYQAATGCVL